MDDIRRHERRELSTLNQKKIQFPGGVNVCIYGL